MKNIASREARATPALTLLKEDPAFEAGIGSVSSPESSPEVVLFRGTVGVTVGVATGVGGEMVCK